MARYHFYFILVITYTLALFSLVVAIHAPPQQQVNLTLPSPATAARYHGSDFHEGPLKSKEVSMERHYDRDWWKTHVIMGCTVVAGVEVFVIVLILKYWKQLRWSMRRIECSCCNGPWTRSQASNPRDDIEAVSLGVDNGSDSFVNVSTADISSDSHVAAADSDPRAIVPVLLPHNVSSHSSDIYSRTETRAVDTISSTAMQTHMSSKLASSFTDEYATIVSQSLPDGQQLIVHNSALNS